MSVLIVGGQDIIEMKGVLLHLGVEKCYHIEGSKRNHRMRRIPADAQCVVLLTDSLPRCTTKAFTLKTKRRNLPLLRIKNRPSELFAIFYKHYGTSLCHHCLNACPYFS